MRSPTRKRKGLFTQEQSFLSQIPGHSFLILGMLHIFLRSLNSIFDIFLHDVFTFAGDFVSVGESFVGFENLVG